MKLDHENTRIKPYISDTIENDVVIYQEDKTVLVINETASVILDVIACALSEKKDITTDEISRTLCARYSLGDDRYEEICEAVKNTVNIFFNASLLMKIEKD